EELRALLESLGGDWLFAAPDVPPRKERGARESMGIAPDETVLALADSTIFGSGRDGLVIGAGGIYWQNSIVGGSDNGRLSWDAFARVRAMRATDLTILGERDWVNPPATHGEDVERLLLHLQWWARARMSPGQRREAIAAAGEAEPGLPGAARQTAGASFVSPPASGAAPGVTWHLAIHGAQYGPYEANMIGIMAASGQIDPEACLAWTEGMAAWTPLRQVPALAALVGPTPAPAAPPPIQAPAYAASAPAPTYAAPAQPQAATPDTTAADALIDVNNAPLEELLALPGMTRANAERVVRERGTRGGFADADQLGQLLGLQPHHVQRLRMMVTFGRVAPRARTLDF
ncbi:GYF domain-containing protein, partial [Longimicrobium sp.]|uniref:GYF domain-containing protein n=1 Tax=Longimicrobium sp. TaxID=2029185 RepID=UPI002E30E6E0